MSDKEKKHETKKDPGKIFLDEVSKSPLTLTILAVVTGLLLGGLLVAITSEDVYQAFDLSFWEGIKSAAGAAWSTYEALFFGSVGNPSKIIEALRSGESEAIRRAFNPFFESLVASTPYIFAGLAVALGFRVGLFNIGAEGQIFIGAATTVTAAIFLKGLPAIISRRIYSRQR
jgi:simple sugar transport system permease protein